MVGTMILDGDSFRLRPLTAADVDEWLAGEDDEIARCRRRSTKLSRASSSALGIRGTIRFLASARTSVETSTLSPRTDASMSEVNRRTTSTTGALGPRARAARDRRRFANVS